MPSGTWSDFFLALEAFIKGTGLLVFGMLLVSILVWQFLSSWGKRPRKGDRE